MGATRTRSTFYILKYHVAVLTSFTFSCLAESVSYIVEGGFIHNAAGTSQTEYRLDSVILQQLWETLFNVDFPCYFKLQSQNQNNRLTIIGAAIPSLCYNLVQGSEIHDLKCPTLEN